uniref:Uncharacterized protein n=1 Tax=Neogobius melanostomus TaxID=47308 RepID=A0A8C6TDA0_9GOBI
MGALECVLQRDRPDRDSCYSDAAQTDFTLLIHGGAGEELLLKPVVLGVIEFALEAALAVGSQVLQRGGAGVDAAQRSVEAMENCFLFNAGKGSASIVDGRSARSGSVACVERVRNPVRAARSVLDKLFPHALTARAAPRRAPGNAKRPNNNHPQTVGAVALDGRRGLALTGRVGDTAVVGAGVFADDSLAVSCSGDGDVFLRRSVAQRIASLYHHRGYSLRRACREVMAENLEGVCAGVIAVDRNGDAVIETNAAVMFVGSMIDGVARGHFRIFDIGPHFLVIQSVVDVWRYFFLNSCSSYIGV